MALKRPLGHENKLHRVLTVNVRTLNEWEVYGLEKLSIIFEVYGNSYSALFIHPAVLSKNQVGNIIAFAMFSRTEAKN